MAKTPEEQLISDVNDSLNDALSCFRNRNTSSGCSYIQEAQHFIRKRMMELAQTEEEWQPTQPEDSTLSARCFKVECENCDKPDCTHYCHAERVDAARLGKTLADKVAQRLPGHFPWDSLHQSAKEMWIVYAEEIINIFRAASLKQEPRTKGHWCSVAEELHQELETLKQETQPPSKPWDQWAHKHMTTLRNAIFETVPEAEKNANIGDSAIEKWPAELARRLAEAQSNAASSPLETPVCIGLPSCRGNSPGYKHVSLCPKKSLETPAAVPNALYGIIGRYHDSDEPGEKLIMEAFELGKHTTPAPTDTGARFPKIIVDPGMPADQIDVIDANGRRPLITNLASTGDTPQPQLSDEQWANLNRFRGELIDLRISHRATKEQEWILDALQVVADWHIESKHPKDFQFLVATGKTPAALRLAEEIVAKVEQTSRLLKGPRFNFIEFQNDIEQLIKARFAAPRSESTDK